MMDAVFGQSCFGNEIVWKRTGSHGGVKGWGPIHDTLLFYAKADEYTWNRTYQPYTEDYIERYYRYEDDRGSYQLVSLTGAGASGGESGEEWRGVNPTDSGRHWAVPMQSLRNAYPTRDVDSLSVHERLDLLDEAGLVYWPSGGRGIPRQKRYLDEGKGVAIQDVILDVPPLGSHDNERTGYPTQKPQALARRIIEASSNPGDIVLDCFAGCAYVPVAAELTGRKWIACDMSPRAWTVVRRQFEKHPDLGIETEGKRISDTIELKLDKPGALIHVRGPHDLPERTTDDPPVNAMLRAKDAPVFRQKPLENSKTIWDAFVAHWGPNCWYCGDETRNDRRSLQLDHIEPRDGTNDDCWNRALACPPCNSDKTDRLTPEQTIDKAFEANRIPTDARRDELKQLFRSRTTWAKNRYDTEVASLRLPI